MKFCTAALQHNAGEVREASERIIKALYRDVRAPVKEYLPSDNEKTRKNTLYRMLFEYFDKVDGKPSKSDMKVRYWINWLNMQLFIRRSPYKNLIGST